MTVKMNKKALGHIIAVCSDSNHVQFIGKRYVGLMVKTELSKLKRTCEGKLWLKSKTVAVRFSLPQLVCLETIAAANPEHPTSLVILEYVFNPITKALNEK